MKTLINAISLTAALMFSAGASAGIINFIDLTESGSGYGEGAWNPLTLVSSGITVTITGHATNDNDNTQYAYLDWGRAGLGTCKDVVNNALVNTMVSGRTANNCAPSSDDNVTQYEYLRFAFDKDVEITNFWFNNNHDGGMTAGDQIKIGGTDYNVATGYAGGANGIGSFNVGAGNYIDVAYANTQFYVSGMQIRQIVPEPGTLMLFGLGLLSLVGARRRLAKH